jgi:hypothetical protein
VCSRFFRGYIAISEQLFDYLAALTHVYNPNLPTMCVVVTVVSVSNNNLIQACS